MKPAPFNLHQPETLDEAVATLSEYGDDARVLAGGQSLVVLMNLRMARPAHLVDLSRIPGLAGTAVHGDRLRIGAMTLQRELMTDPQVARHAPLIAAAMPHVGHVQTRSRGTIGGSIAHADPSAELPLVMATLRAEFVVNGRDGERRIAAKDFFIDALTTALEDGDILTAVELPAARADAKVAFHEFARRHGDFAIVAAAAQWSPASGELRVGLGGATGSPLVCVPIEAAISADPERSDVEALIEETFGGLDILSDPQVDADYRRSLAGTVLRRCLTEVLER